MGDDDKELPKAAPHEVKAAVDEVCETDEDAGLLEKVEAVDVAASVEAGKYRDTPVVKVLGFLSEISDQPPAFTLAAATALVGLATRQRRVADVGLRVLAALTVATATKAAVKAVVVRTRPFMLLEHGEYETGVMGPNDGPWNSFPSGHTANAVAAARAIARVYPEAAGPVGLAAAGIAAIQVPRAAHHATDVLAGAVVGWVAEEVSDRTLASARVKVQRVGMRAARKLVGA